MYIRGFNSLAAIFLFFLLYAMSCTFSNTISFSLLSPIPSLPVLILILPSPHIPVLATPNPHPSYIPVPIAKSHVSQHVLPLYCIAILSKSAPTPKFPSTPRHKFLAFHSCSLPTHYTLRTHIERMGILTSNDSGYRTRVILGHPSSTSYRK
jgi:hypothetical protein